MNLKLCILIAITLSLTFGKSIKDDYADVSLNIIAKALTDSTAYNRLGYMCDTFGPRLSGSKNLEKAINWIQKEMKKDGFSTVQGERVKVPVWIRGDESVTLLKPFYKELSILGSLIKPLHPTVVRGFSKYTRIIIHSASSRSFCSVASLFA